MKMNRKYRPELVIDGLHRSLKYPFLDTKKEWLAATNGHVLITFPVSIDSGDVDGYIPCDVLDYARKKAELFDKDISIKALQTKLIVDTATFKRPPNIDDEEHYKFPSIDLVLSNIPNSPDDIIFGVDKGYIDNIAEALNVSEHDETIFFRFSHGNVKTDGGYESAIRIYPQKNMLAPIPKEVAVIMPVRWCGEKIR